jgi:predicted PurR-regulated permease PerM
MDKEIRVSITPGTIFTALLVIAGAWALWLLRDLALLVLTAIVIASAIEPGILFFVRYRVPRVAAALLMYVGVFGALFALVYFFFPPIIADLIDFLSTIPQYLDTLNLASIPGIGDAASLISTQHEAQTVMQTLLALKTVFSGSSSSVVQLIATFFGGIFSLVLVIVLSFYFALQETGVDDFLRVIVPAAHEEYAVGLWKRAQKKIGLWMQGQILLSVIVGVLIYLGLLILGIPYAFLLSVFTALAEIIPIFGSIMAGAFAVVVGYSDGGVALSLIVLGLYVVVNQFETNLIYPLIVKKVVGVPPLLVIVALIAGGTLAGFLGVLLSVPVAAVMLELISDLQAHKWDRARKREASAAGSDS